MRLKLHYIFLLFAFPLTSLGQETFPVNGVHDERIEFHAFTNAIIFAEAGQRIDSATLIVQDGKVVAVGKSLPVPAGSVVHDCSGLFIYPSFIDPYAGLLVEKRKRGTKAPTKKPEAGNNWNPAIHPETEYSPSFPLNKKLTKDWLASGIGVASIHQPDGIMRGSGSVIHLGIEQPNLSAIDHPKQQYLSFSKGTSTFDYPSSHIGAIALIRQTLYDADWYSSSGKEEEFNVSLNALNTIEEGPHVFELNHPLSYRNVEDISQEFGLSFILKGTGNEYLVKDEMAPSTQIILPVELPKAYAIEDPLDARVISLSEMKHWETAPYCPSLLLEEGHTVALTRDTIKSSKTYLANLRRFVQSGLDHDALLGMLTSTPAKMLGIDGKVGSIKAEMIANFFISNKPLTEKGFEVVEHWNKGELVYEKPVSNAALIGEYNLVIEKKDYVLNIERIESGKVTAKAKLKDGETELGVKVAVQNELITINLFSKDGSLLYSLSGKVSLSGTLLDGRGTDRSGNWVSWAGVKDRTSEGKKEETADATSSDSLPEIRYPNKAYGWDTLDESNTFVITNAVVWTCADTGRLENADVWVENGKIKWIGSGALYPDNLKRIDAKGRHLTPGIVDEHSHIALRGGVNEWAQASSAEVRIADAVDPWSIQIYRQLGGGVTAAQLLHGSANPIGGQSALVKFKWGKTADDMLIDDADGFIKFALGENVKRSNTKDNKGRFPLTRMGVEQSFVDAFTRAQEYMDDRSVVEPPKRSRKYMSEFKEVTERMDLEMEAVAEVLRKERFITCHSYVQSEILMLMAVADSFGFNVNTFTHILEGYKVAEEMVEHGAGGSTFSDWWAYKYEVNDAIPYNAALMSKAGVVTAINSDDAEMGRRLNQEAAKAVKYGGVSEEEALTMVTLNPAKLLHLDDRMGSIEVGKDADIVLWSDNPLSIYSRAEKTFIEGVKYYDINHAEEHKELIQHERARLIEKMMKSKDQKKRPVQTKESKHYHCDTILEDYINE